MTHAQQLLTLWVFMGALYALGMACLGAAIFMERHRIHNALELTGWRLRLTITLAILLWWIPALMMIWRDVRKWRTRNSRSNVDA